MSFFIHANAAEYADQKPVSVLIVDDDPGHRMLEKEILDSPGCRVLEACSGVEALDILRSSEVDVVILDKCMPGINGDDVCRYIRNEMGLAMLPILMVTGSGDLDNLTSSLTAGATDFLRKPYLPAELIARVNASARQKRVADQLDSAEAMLFALARMVEAKDGTTGDHCTRLAHYGVVLGKALGLGPDELMALRRGGVLHDIGKLGIPDSILLKPGKLTDFEWDIMKQHVHIGARIVGGLKSMRLTVPIIQHHHERWDGTGYPDGLRAEEIPLLARVFQIVDIYDALTHARPYKRAMSQEEVVAVLKEETARGWRDPHIMSVFLDILQTRFEDLQEFGSTQDELGLGLFGEIKKTGALEWDSLQASALQ